MKARIKSKESLKNEPNTCIVESDYAIYYKYNSSQEFYAPFARNPEGYPWYSKISTYINERIHSNGMIKLIFLRFDNSYDWNVVLPWIEEFYEDTN